MHERTRLRLAMLANGYWPTKNKGKRPTEPGWQKQRPDETRILEWDRSIHASTGMKLDHDLAAIDVDVVNEALITALADAVNARYPLLFVRGFVRHAGGPKEAWFARVDVPFARFASRHWHPAGADPNDPETPMHRIECFGSHKTRQFGVFGPHGYKAGKIVSAYQFAGDANPANTPRDFLPVLPKAAFPQVCDLFDGIAAQAGLVMLKADKGLPATGTVYDLTDDMRFESESGTYRLDELETAYFVAQHEGRELRVTSSFLGHGRNPRKCIVGFKKRSRCICIHDFETGLTHMPADRKPAPDRLREQMIAFIAERREKGVHHGQ
jgi:hypothetical protein